MATYELPNTANTTQYVNGESPGSNVITKVTDGKSGSVLNVGDKVTVTWASLPGAKVEVFEAEFIGTMSVTVSGQTQVFMVLKEIITGFGGGIFHYVVGLEVADAPSKIAETGASKNISAESFTVCFFPGTLIATPSGERMVEELAAGDPILIGDSGSIPATWFGRKSVRTVSVKWIGWQTISTLFGPAERLKPVRFTAGSLGGGGGASA